MFSFGYGGLGHKDSEWEDIPRRVEINVQNRAFNIIGADLDETLVFAQMSLLSINPRIGPSNGGTRLNLLCTGVFNSSVV